MSMMNAPASAALAHAMPKAMRLMRTGDAPTSRSANGSCATAMTARPMKVSFPEQFEHQEHEQRASERYSQAQRQRDRAEIRGCDVGRLHITEVDAEQHDQDHLGEENI